MAYIPNDTGTNFSTYIVARIVYSYTATSTGHDVTASFQLRRTNSAGSTYSYPSSTTININGDSYTWSWDYNNYPSIPGYDNSWQTFATRTVSVTHTAATNILIAASNNNMGAYLTGYIGDTVTLPALASPPSGGSITNVSVTSNSISATCSLTSWGSTTSNAFKRLCVLETGHYITTVGEPQYVDEKVSTALSTTHTVDNNSVTFNNPSWTIQPNTSYNIGIYAATVDGECRYNYPSNPVTTLAAAATVSVGSVTGTTAAINYSTSADGGASNKEIQYSLDGGTTWTTGATVSTGSASSGSFTISGLSGYTTYTIDTRVHTTAGDVSGSTLSVTTDTIAPDTPTVSVATNNTYNSLNVAWGTASFGAPNTGEVSIYSGTSASPTQLQYTRTTTGTSLWTNTGLAANTRYYYRARAKNSANVWSSYSSDSSAVTRAKPATVALDSLTSTSATISYSFDADGGEYDKDLEYSLDGTNWTLVTTITGGSAASSTFTVSGLTPGNTYNIRTRVKTTAGVSTGSTIVVNPSYTCAFYGSVNDQSKKIAKLYGSVNGETKLVKKLYGSVNGVTKLFYEG